jgi:PAS domain S-box-containing protein
MTEHMPTAEEIRALNAELERRVQERTAQLAQFKSALDEHAIVAITDSRGKITYVNDKFCAISKYAREDLIGQDHRIINSGHHTKAFIGGLWQTIGSGRVWQGEIKNRAKDGSFYWVATTIVPFLDEHGTPVQYIAIRADITERKRAEEEISQLNADLQVGAVHLEQANKELESFAYSVAHDLRAPLRHVHGYVEMLKRTTAGQLSEKSQRYVKTISEASTEMARLIDDLLAFSRMSRTEMQESPVDLNALVRNMIRALDMTTTGRNITWQVAPLPTVVGDPSMLKVVLANLLDNAVKYSRQRDPARIEIGSAGEEDGRAVLFVRDNGAGFDMQYAHKLFGVFQRLHRSEEFEGTGIGLATLRRIVTRHGGRVWAEGALDQGATFYFTVKRSPSA